MSVLFFRMPENHIVGQTRGVYKQASVSSWRRSPAWLSLPLVLPGYWTQISISCEWRDCAGRVSRRSGPRPSPSPLSLRTPLQTSTPRTSAQSSQRQQSAESTAMGAALPDHEDMCVLSTVLMCKMSAVKQKEHRQKGAS